MCGFHHGFYADSIQGFLRDHFMIRVNCQKKNCHSIWTVAEEIAGLQKGSQLPECRFQPSFCQVNVIQIVPNAKKNLTLPQNSTESQKAEITCSEGYVLYSKSSLVKINGHGQRYAEYVCSKYNSVTGRAWKHSQIDQFIMEGNLECKKGKYFSYFKKCFISS